MMLALHRKGVPCSCMTSSNQPYDSSMKALLKEDTAAILAYFLPGATLIGPLDIEVLPAPRRVDRAYSMHYRNMAHIFHLEFQASADPLMAYRMNAYHAELLLEYLRPIISMVVYLFKSDVVEPYLNERSGDEEILHFRFRVIPLWHLDGQQIVEEHTISMYTLLPTMKNVDARLLQQAIDEMIQYYGDDERKLARRIFWLELFLRRSEMITPEDKNKVQERLDVFDQLLEEDEYIQQQRALGREEGLAEGLARGEAKAKKIAQDALVNAVQFRFPALKKLAQRQAEQTPGAEDLSAMANAIMTAADEAAARAILNPPSAA